ncbi:MAG: outer membrane lipoprotein carrier protein LolA [Polyangiaceae bacterium]
MRPFFKAALIFCVACVPSLAAHSSYAQTAPVTAAPAVRVDVPKLVEKVQNFYDHTTSFKSDFKQEYYVHVHDRRISSHGRVTFSKPGKMDWVYDDPKDNRVVSDGALVKVYEAANHQMFEQHMTQSQYPAALAFLTGQGKLADLFDFTIPDGMSFPAGTVLQGVPKQATPAYAKVLFYIDNATSQVRRVLIIDGQSNRNRFDFENPRVNEPVPASQFQLNPPQGTTIIRP